ncbi:universal stress protein [Nonomuraea sp. NPDC048901]|uniref:universal stress protein n=1 Tax=Nonomuraea sp. NPDC048901 TaxID=3155627 RepID=UPI0033F00B5F
MIIVGVDGSMTARAAVEWAVNDALRMREPLRIVHAVDRSPYQIGRFPNAALPDTLLREGHRILREALALAHERQPDVEVTTQDIEGAPAEVLREQAKEATEIVLGSRGLGGFAGALLGSVNTHVAGHVDCPVVVVRGDHQPVHGEIVVGVDGSPACEPALAYAFRQAELRGAALRVVHAWQLPVHAYAPGVPYEMDEIRTAQHQIVRDRVGTFTKGYPRVTVVEDVQPAQPVEALTDASAGADLLVVGSHGHSTVGAMLLGSVSRGVLHHTRCPVAVVRA